MILDYVIPVILDTLNQRFMSGAPLIFFKQDWTLISLLKFKKTNCSKSHQEKSILIHWTSLFFHLLKEKRFSFPCG